VALPELASDYLGFRMRVAHEHASITVTSDRCHLRHTQALLEKPAHGLVPEIVKA
jgi:hypothetical protein